MSQVAQLHKSGDISAQSVIGKLTPPTESREVAKRPNIAGMQLLLSCHMSCVGSPTWASMRRKGFCRSAHGAAYLVEGAVLVILGETVLLQEVILQEARCLQCDFVALCQGILQQVARSHDSKAPKTCFRRPACDMPILFEDLLEQSL